MYTPNLKALLASQLASLSAHHPGSWGLPSQASCGGGRPTAGLEEWAPPTPTSSGHAHLAPSVFEVRTKVT